MPQTLSRPPAGPETDRTERASRDAEIVEQIVVRAFGLSEPHLRSATRGRQRVAFARQVALYAMHVRFGHTQRETARQFGRDRTTVAHACRTVEDRRDLAAVDQLVDTVESALGRWIAADDHDHGHIHSHREIA